MLRRRLAKLSKWRKCLPLAEERADFTPYQTTRIVAKERKRFCPIASKKPRFCVAPYVAVVCIDLDAMSGRMVSSEARYCLSTFVLPPGCPVPYASDSS